MKIKKLGVLLAGLLLFSSNIILADDIESNPPCHTIQVTGTHVTCFGDTDGTALLTISGGTGNFTITWSNGVTGVNSISNLAAGYYDVQVVDNTTGCSAIDVINITEPDLLVTSISIEHVNCFGDNTGAINLTITGGTMPYDSDWSSGQTSQNISNVIAGDYQVTIIDDHNCESYNEGTIDEPMQALGSSYVTSDVLCTNGSDGSIDLTVWGGTPPYTYEWLTEPEVSQNRESLFAGSYSVLIKDKNGCENFHTINIDEPTILIMSSTDVQNLCYGESHGNISLSVIGGTEPYTYEWANGDFLLSYDTPIIDQIPNGNYFVSVTDFNGCSLTDNYSIMSPDEIITTISGTNVNAVGGSDGQIILDVVGGVSPYSFYWSNGIITQNNPNVPSGLYEVTVTDVNNCNVYNSIFIQEPLEPLGFTYISTNATCHGSTDGSIFTYANGGEPPYIYTWSTGIEISYINELAAGTYSLTLTDANAIEFVDEIIITNPDPITFIHTYTEPSCKGFYNGNIDITTAGGTEPYKYYWYDSEYALAGLTEDISNINAGNYVVEVIDTLGCEAQYSITISEPTEISLSLTEDQIQCAGGTTGNIYSLVSGGTEPYSYYWSNGETGENLENISIGDYFLTVSDINGCLTSEQTTIIEPEPIYIDLYPIEVSCSDQTDGSITSFVSGGSGGYTYSWSNFETTENIYDLAAGDYTLTVTDIYNCSSELETTVTKVDIACLSIPTSFSPNGDGINDTWVITNIYLYPECRMQIFNKWGNLIFESNGYTENWDGTYNGNPLPTGTYYYIFSFSSELETLTGTITILI